MQNARHDDLCGLAAPVLIWTLVHFNQVLVSVDVTRYYYAPVNWNPHPLPPGQHRLLTSIDQKYCPWGWGIWQILTPHMSTPRDNMRLLTRSAVLTRMGTLALTLIWVNSPSINAIVFSIQGSVIYLQSSLVVYVTLFNNKICCFKKSCFLLYHKEL